MLLSQWRTCKLNYLIVTVGLIERQATWSMKCFLIEIGNQVVNLLHLLLISQKYGLVGKIWNNESSINFIYLYCWGASQDGKQNLCSFMVTRAWILWGYLIYISILWYTIVKLATHCQRRCYLACCLEYYLMPLDFEYLHSYFVSYSLLIYNNMKLINQIIILFIKYYLKLY